MKRFGISRGVSPRESFTQVAENAKEVEDLGFDMLWFIDHQLGMKDVYAAMNVAALNTRHIEIGSAVTQFQTRSMNSRTDGRFSGSAPAGSRFIRSDFSRTRLARSATTSC